MIRRFRTSPRSVRLVLPALLLVSGITIPAHGAGERYPDGLRPPLDEVLEQAAPGQLVPVSVVLKDRVAPERLRAARAGLSPDEGRRAVLDLLKRNARASQSGLLAEVRRLSLEGQVANIRPLWIGNVVGIDATPEVIRRIAARPEVDWVNHNPKIDISLDRDDRDELTAGSGAGDARASDVGVDETECGVELMNAPQVWNDLGVTGDGAVVAVIDTGTCWTHSDIQNQVWVNPGEDLDGDGVVMDPDDENGVDDDGNGFVDDLVGWNFEVSSNSPDDTNSHGSHCSGTVAGDGTAGTQAGMAPDAKIMILKVGVTFSDEIDVWNAMQYAADNGADSISMSLGWPHNQNPDRATWRDNCDNTIEAGTAMVIAAGNEGQGNEPDNVRTPGDVPRIISVGATDCSDVAAGFSSRGPVTWQNVDPYNDHPWPPGLNKPDISAPGVSTKSHNICNGYSFKSGTSMATPHVAGAVALMKSANSGLSHDEIKQVLMDTSVDLGDAGLDNTYGQGRVDAFAAVDEVFGLTFESVTVDDSDPSYGNGDAGIDTGEIVTLKVSLRNQLDDTTAVNVRGFITTDEPNVTLVHDFATWADVPPLGVVETDGPHFSVRIEEDCNYPIPFQLTLSYTDKSDRRTRATFSVRVGSPFDRTLLADDFETDHGWSRGGSSSGGRFVREDPDGLKDDSGGDIQPEDDVTENPGVRAWVSGNNDQFGGDDDVDAGDVFIVSPALDATDFESLDVSYSRWFYAFPSTSPPSDYFRAQWSRDEGATWNTLEEIDVGEPAWTAVTHPLPAGAFGPDLRIRFQVEDSPVVIIESVVEGLVDEFTLAGSRIECDLFAPPAVQPPNGIGDTLRVNVEGGDIRFSWTESPVDADHDAATLYRLYRSADPDAGYAVDGLSQEAFHVDGDGATALDTGYFLIVPENGGGTSGEEPL